MCQNIDFQKLGKRIHSARTKKGLELKQLSEMLGIEQGSLANIESGNSAPSTDLLFNLSDILDVPVDYLLMDSLNNKDIVIDYMINDLFVATTAPQKKRLLAIANALLDAMDE